MNNLYELKFNCDKIIEKNWIKSSKKGNGSAGFLFEQLLNIPTNNFEIADYMGIEIKTKISKRENYISLFCATPDSYLFEIKRIYETYGYTTDSSGFKSFNVSLYASKKISIGKDRFCKLKIDYLNKKILLLIFNNNGDIIDSNISWSFDIIKEKLERKLNYLLMVKGDRKYELGEIYYKFTSYKFYKLTDFYKFLMSIEKGYVRISFSIGTFKSGKRIGQIYDHGTCFNIHKDYLDYIFDEIMLDHDIKKVPNHKDFIY